MQLSAPGAASSLYGDAAVDGVIKLVTNRGAADSDRWTASAGGAGLLQAPGEVKPRWSGRAYDRLMRYMCYR